MSVPVPHGSPQIVRDICHRLMYVVCVRVCVCVCVCVRVAGVQTSVS
jgi:hypothetical protein